MTASTGGAAMVLERLKFWQSRLPVRVVDERGSFVSRAKARPTGRGGGLLWPEEDLAPGDYVLEFQDGQQWSVRTWDRTLRRTALGFGFGGWTAFTSTEPPPRL